MQRGERDFDLNNELLKIKWILEEKIVENKLFENSKS
jgi:hypothetical protein